MAFRPFSTSYTSEPSRPSGGPRPGAIALLDWICDDSPWASSFTSLGIYVPRDICGNLWPRWECVGSQHARGAAGDAGCRVVRPGGLVAGWELAVWLTRNHAILGVQEVIFAGQRWTNQTLRWKVYTGRSDHYDHVHFALNASGAAFLTLERIESVAPAAPGPAPDPVPVPVPDPPDDEEDPPMLYQSPGGAVVLLRDGKLVQITKLDNKTVTPAEQQQLVRVAQALPEYARQPVKCSSPFWQTLTRAYTLVK